MTQIQFDTIVKIIQNGAPALAGELVEAFAAVVVELQEIKSQKDENPEKSKEE